jgi:8-amino-7-oxononanoate synthase
MDLTLETTTAVVLCSPNAKETLVNYARNFIYTTAPSFPSLACVQAGYNLLENSDGEEVSIIASAFDKD